MQAAAHLKKVDNSWFLSRIVFLAVVFLGLNLVAGRFYFIVSGAIYPTAHIIMEFASIIVAMSVSLMSWYDYRFKGEARSLILSAAFCLVGLIDFAHSLSYFGMPDFITPNSVNKASTYWVLARIIQAAGILAAVLAGPKLLRVRTGLVLPISIAASALVVYMTAVHPDLLPPMYDLQHAAQTPLKIYIEYAVMAAMLAAALLILKKRQKDSGDFYLGAALLAGIMGELAFTFYSNAYDAYNLLGHLYKIVSFSFILKALLEEALAAIYRSNLELERKGRELAEANSQLRMADKLKNDFLANTNHELRSPLSAIVAFTELLLDQENTGKLNHLQKDYLKEINESSQVLQFKINGLLYLSGVLGGKVVLHLEEVSLREIAEEVVSTYQSAFRQKGVALRVFSIGDGTVHGDREKISRILVNLLENGLKFTDPGGSVEVEVGTGPGSGESFFSVRDSGIGINRSQHESIYNLFYQVDGTSTRKYGGTGIGLTLAAKLVAMHGGRIELESQCGIGSKFTVILPVTGPRRLNDVP
ncbi:MAG: sensor histidine kinase [Desulfocucumaceae bacterium]